MMVSKHFLHFYCKKQTIWQTGKTYSLALKEAKYLNAQQKQLWKFMLVVGEFFYRCKQYKNTTTSWIWRKYHEKLILTLQFPTKRFKLLFNRNSFMRRMEIKQKKIHKHRNKVKLDKTSIIKECISSMKITNCANKRT